MRASGYLSTCAGVVFMFSAVSGEALAKGSEPRADGAPAPVEKIECPSPPLADPDLARSDTYKDTPFKSGEEAIYEVRYGGVLVGSGAMEVKPPERYNGKWQRVFHAHGKTGEWYKLVFVAENIVQAISRPWDWGVTRFFMHQDEGKMLGSRLVQKKWLDFDHTTCRVKERIAREGKPERNLEFDVAHAATDALGAAYRLRTIPFEMGKVERFLVYTSEKNWWLEATPVAQEEIKTAPGTYQTIKVRLQTFLGKQLQQSGDVFVWIDQSTPARPLVRVQGEIKIGSVWMELAKFKPGT